MRRGEFTRGGDVAGAKSSPIKILKVSWCSAPIQRIKCFQIYLREGALKTGKEREICPSTHPHVGKAAK